MSNGVVEEAGRTIRDTLRVYKIQLETKLKREFDVSSPMTSRTVGGRLWPFFRVLKSALWLLLGSSRACLSASRLLPVTCSAVPALASSGLDFASCFHASVWASKRSDSLRCLSLRFCR